MPIKHVPTIVGMGVVAHTVEKTSPKKKRKRAAETWKPKRKKAKPKAGRRR